MAMLWANHEIVEACWTSLDAPVDLFAWWAIALAIAGRKEIRLQDADDKQYEWVAVFVAQAEMKPDSDIDVVEVCSLEQAELNLEACKNAFQIQWKVAFAEALSVQKHRLRPT